MKVKSNNLNLSKKQYPPLTGQDKKLIIIFSIMLFLITFNYGMLRVMKDVQVLKYANSHYTSFLKLWVVLFMFIFKAIYDILAKRVGKNNMFYWLVGLFTLFFLTYNLFAASFISEVPEGKHSYFFILRKIWPIVCFYVMAETWGTYMLSVSFWSLANRTMSNQQAKRFYTTLSLGAAISTILAGLIMIFVSEKENVIWVVIALNLVLVGVYYYFMRDMKLNPNLYSHGITKKKKKKLGFFDSIKALFTSEDAGYLGLILLLVMGYGMGINFFEVIYKQFVKDTGRALHAGNTDEAKQAVTFYTQKMFAYQLIVVGVFSLCLVFLASLVKKRGWRFTASVVPGALGIGCIVFFGACYCKGASMDEDTMNYLAIFGLCIVAIVKSSKYVFFDTTKEQTYKVCNEETQLTGKSAVDGIGSRLSKATSSFIVIQVIMPLTGADSILENKGVVGCCLFTVLAIWLWAVGALSKRYEKRLQAYEAEKKQLAKQAETEEKS
ncbi:MAG: Npt1/Npt2 family nucleotide transporter [Bacteroidota bacterium]